MAYLDATTFAGALKTLYPDWALENMVFQNNPFLALIPKEENFGGDYKKIPVIIGAPQNTSADFSVAANSGSSLTTSSLIKAFLLSRARKYALAEVSNETMLASQGNENAFMEAVKVEMDGAIRSISNQLGLDIFRDGSGTVGQLSATSGVTTSITFADPTQTLTLEVGTALRFSTASDGTGLKTGTLSITAINRNTGVATLSASGATLTPVLAVNDYIYISGNQAANVKGLDAWIPTVAPTSGDNFFSVDRSVDSRLYGAYLDKSSSPIEEALLDVDQTIYSSGGKASHIITSPTQYNNLAKSLGSRIIYQQLTVGGVGFQSFEIQGQSGPIKVLADRSCAKNVAYVLQLDTWKLSSLGKMAQIYTGDGLSMLRSTTADSVRAQIAFYGQICTAAPGWNAKVFLG
jgi:hypothetical protein